MQNSLMPQKNKKKKGKMETLVQTLTSFGDPTGNVFFHHQGGQSIKQLKSNPEGLPLLALNGHIEMVDYLINSGVAIDSHGNNRETAILNTCRKGDVAMFDVLIKYNPDINLQNRQGATPLILASANGHKEIVHRLCEANAVLDNMTIDEWSPDETVQSFCPGTTALLAASVRGHCQIVEILTSSNCNINIQNDYGSSALMEGICENHPRVVSILLSKGADLELKREQDRLNAFLLAAKYGLEEMVNLLIAAGIDLSSQGPIGENALHVAAMNGNVTIVKALINAGVPLDSENVGGETATIMASIEGHVEVVDALIKGNADLMKRDIYGATALLRASRNGHEKVVQALVTAGVILDDRLSCRGPTALHMAVQKGHLDVAKILVQAGASTNLQVEGGGTPLDYAKILGHLPLIQLLGKATE